MPVLSNKGKEHIEATSELIFHKLTDKDVLSSQRLEIHREKSEYRQHLIIIHTT